MIVFGVAFLAISTNSRISCTKLLNLKNKMWTFAKNTNKEIPEMVKDHGLGIDLG